VPLTVWEVVAVTWSLMRSVLHVVAACCWLMRICCWSPLMDVSVCVTMYWPIRADLMPAVTRNQYWYAFPRRRGAPGYILPLFQQHLLTDYSHNWLVNLMKSSICFWSLTIDTFTTNTLCSEKNTHSHFLSYLHEFFVDLNKNCSVYTQWLVDSNNVKKLDIHCDWWRNWWRNICQAKVGASLQHAISRDPKDIIFYEYRVLAGA